MEHGQHVVRDAERRVVHHHEDEPDGHQGVATMGRIASVRRRPRPQKLPVEQERHHDAEHRLAGDHRGGEVERADHRHLEPGIAEEDPPVVGEADGLRRREARREPVWRLIHTV